MRVEKGDKMLCIKTVVMNTGNKAFIEGKIYESYRDECLKNEQGNNHIVSNIPDEDDPEGFLSKYFVKYVVNDNIGTKETEGKLSYELDFGFIKQMAERMDANKGKYEPYNWQKTQDIKKLSRAILRHLMEVLDENYEDDGREFGHLEAIALGAMMINYQVKNND